MIRNAGGRATDDVLRSLIISSQLLGTRELMVIHHTDCGMLTFTNEDVWSKIEVEPVRTPATSTSCRSQSLRAASGRTRGRSRESPFLPGDAEVTSWVYDVRTGQLRQVEDA